MQISVYSMHENLAVPKIMEVMRTEYTKSGIQSQHTSNYTRQTMTEGTQVRCERKACIVCEEHFSVSLNRLMLVKVVLVCYSFLYFVRMHFQILVCKFLVHLRVCIS